MTLKEWLFFTHKTKDEILNEGLNNFSSNSVDILYYYTRPRIYCNDGFYISVQGGRRLYSEPVEYGTIYKSLEIGFPSDYNDDIFKDVDDDVKGYVLIEEIEECLIRHNGIDEKKTFEDFKTKSYIRYKKLENIIS